MEAKVFHSPYGTGVAIVTGASRFTLATNIDDLKLRRLPEVPGTSTLLFCPYLFFFFLQYLSIAFVFQSISLFIVILQVSRGCHLAGQC